MALNEELSLLFERFKEHTPDAIKSPVLDAKAQFEKEFDLTATIQIGDRLPDFSMRDSTGQVVASSHLLQRGPLVITFYRGSWCQFCNPALSALQKHLDDFKTRGVTLVAISPEVPTYSSLTAARNDLHFPILSDPQNQFARRLGLINTQLKGLRTLVETFGNKPTEHNEDDSLEVPVAATLLVDRDGIVRNRFVDPDFTKRVEPLTVLEWIDALKQVE
ncbi:redoxin domain-containing protein [Aspergillus egyptiacus]|nr:redoxin domain-containing protein [Aspergillus egyptiacus]